MNTNTVYKEKQSILLIGNHLNSSATNKNVWHYLAEKLKQAGWNVHTTSNKVPKILRLIDMVWTIISKRNDYSLAQVDVFSDRAFIWAEVCTCLLFLMEKPIILVLHGGGLPDFSQKHTFRFKRVINAATAVIAPSFYLLESLKRYRKDIQMIPNPVEINQYPFIKRAEIKPNLIWVRAFHQIYNPSIVPSIMKELSRTWPDANLVMVGPDKGDGSLQAMQNLANDLNVSGRIKVAGKVPHDDVPTWLSQSDVFINTTNFDNTPSSLIEAMANGLCIVSTNVGGIPWLVEDGSEALLVPPNNSEAMVNAIRRVLSDPTLASTLSVNGRKKAETFDWSVVLPQWETLYREVLENA